MECSRQESWSWSPFPTAGDLPDPGIKPVSPVSPALAGRVFATVSPGNPGILCSNGPESASRSLPALLAWVWDADVTSTVKLPQRVETPRPEGPLRVHTRPHLSMIFPLPLHPHLQPMLHRLVVCGSIWGVSGWGWGARAPGQKSSCRQQCKFHHFPDGPCEQER